MWLNLIKVICSLLQSLTGFLSNVRNREGGIKSGFGSPVCVVGAEPCGTYTYGSFFGPKTVQ